MNPNDLLIIYLACGAPFGVYYFFDKRGSQPANRLWLKSFAAFLFWIPYALNISVKHRKSLKAIAGADRARSDADSALENKIISIQKEFEKILLKSKLKLSIYEFRETAERYTGLTLAKQNVENSTNSVFSESEIFKFHERRENIKISSICLNRRNRNRLSFHQKNARRDFLNILNEILSSSIDKKSLGNLSFEFVTLLNDKEAEKALLEMFGDFQQSGEIPFVKNTENELWKTETHKPSHASRLSIRLRTLTAAANLPKKD